MAKDIGGHINNLIEADPKADIVKVQKYFYIYNVSSYNNDNCI